MVFNHDFGGVVIYAENVDARSGRLENIFLHDQRDPSSIATIFAHHGNIFSNPQSLSFSISLKNGTILNQPPKDQASSFQTLRFDTYDINLSFEDKGAGSRRSKLEPKTLTMKGINESLASQPTETNRHLLKIEWHKRLALCLAPFLFALVGVPLGIHSPRSGKIGGFAVALLIFLTYFVLSSFAESICKDANIKIYGLIWIPNVLFMLAGSYLIFCASREKDIFYYLPNINLPSILRGFGKGEK
jgi:lipopolysaccharide export system permease protein